MIHAYITGSGMAHASREVTNKDLCDMFPSLVTSDGWLLKNVGIKKRYFADDGETLVEILLKASREAIEQSGVRKIDRVIVGSNSQARSFPATASDVAKGLKDMVDLSSAWCFDVQNGCPSGLAAIYLGVDAIRSGQAETVLAMGGDLTSRILDFFDRNTCLLLGDAASAFVLTREDKASSGGIALKVLSHWAQTDFESAGIMTLESGASHFSPFYISRKTRDAAQEAVKRITGRDRIPEKITKEQEEELLKAGDELRSATFPPNGNAPYGPSYRPYFSMAGAEVLEKIRRIVPDCGYLPALRWAGIGLDIFEEHGLLKTDRVSDIPAGSKREVLEKLQERYDILVPHQANLRAHQNLSAALRVPMSKIYSNIAEYANTSAAAAGLALYEALRKPSRYRTIRGDLTEIVTPMLDVGAKSVVLSFGSGMNVVFIVVERLR